MTHLAWRAPAPSRRDGEAEQAGKHDTAGEGHADLRDGALDRDGPLRRLKRCAASRARKAGDGRGRCASTIA